MKQLSCRYCKKNFENGEFVAISPPDKFYHTIIRHLEKEPMTCLIAQMYSREDEVLLEIFNKFTRQEAVLSGYIGVHYNRGLYHYDKINKLQNLAIKFNDNKNGDKIIGDLEQLSSMKPFFPKKTFKQKYLDFLEIFRLND